jgi:hypothetical protein
LLVADYQALKNEIRPTYKTGFDSIVKGQVAAQGARIVF